MKLVPGGMDQVLLFAVVALVALGLVMVFSASSVNSLERYGDKFHFFTRQAAWAVVGSAGMALFTLVDYRRLRQFAVPGLIVAFGLLVLVFVPGIGHYVRGAARWIRLGPVGLLTPSVVAQFALILYLAATLAENERLRDSFREYVLPNLVIVGAAGLLILKQPDLSSTVIVVVSSFLVIAVAHGNLKNMGALVLLGLVALVILILVDPMRFRRVTAFLDPWKDPYGAGYHVIQSILALGSGGLTGVGLGQSRQKFEYLPDEHTDFIFAVVGEELGYVGALLVVGLFAVLVWRGIRAALAAPDLFGLLLAFGLTMAVGSQAWLNVAVVVGCMPTTGVALPFISYGGTSLLFFMCAAGIILNVSWMAERERFRRVRTGRTRTDGGATPLPEAVRREAR